MKTLRQRIRDRHGTPRGWWREIVAQTGWRLGALTPFVHISPPRVRRLVFVCLGNLNRSAFAAAAARRLGIPAHAVLSFGIAAPQGAAPSRLAQRVAAEFGVDLSAHRAQLLSDYEYQPGDLLVAMEVRHARYLSHQGFSPTEIVLLGRWATPPRIHLHDPQGLSEAYCRHCFEQLLSSTKKLSDELSAGGSPVWQVTRS